LDLGAITPFLWGFEDLGRSRGITGGADRLQQARHAGARGIVIYARHGIGEIDMRSDHAGNGLDRLFQGLRAMRAGHADDRQLDMIELRFSGPRSRRAYDRCRIHRLVHPFQSFIRIPTPKMRCGSIRSASLIYRCGRVAP
jgi:hypothetical protein